MPVSLAMAAKRIRWLRWISASSRADGSRPHLIASDNRFMIRDVASECPRMATHIVTDVATQLTRTVELGHLAQAAAGFT